MNPIVEEMNLKIAEWMGEINWCVVWDSDGRTGRCISKHEAQELVSNGKALRYYHDRNSIPDYHSDWNALMPVVERIAEKQGNNLYGTISFLTDYVEYIDDIANLHLAVFNYIKQTA